MKNLNCIRCEVTVRFNEKLFKKKEFLLDIEKKSLKKDEIIAFSYGSKNKRKKEHCHFVISLDKEDSTFQIVYHQGKSEDEDVREPYMENLPEWIASFFKQEEFDFDMSIAFGYDDKYESELKLKYPLYPLLLESVLYENALLSGHQIEFPEHSAIERIFLSSLKDTIAIVVNGSIPIKIKDFNVYKEMKRFSEYTQVLVSKKGETNA